jgi:hypothetical protein
MRLKVSFDQPDRAILNAQAPAWGIGPASKGTDRNN